MRPHQLAEAAGSTGANRGVWGMGVGSAKTALSDTFDKAGRIGNALTA